MPRRYVAYRAPVTDTFADIAERWRAARPERQARRHLERADFDVLRDAGFLQLAVPEDQGGAWRDPTVSLRPITDALRTLAGGDPAVALVSAMHPAVLSYWLGVDDPGDADWVEQRRAVFASAAAGEQWGTITSEPGSGGDIAKTRSTADPDDGVDPFLPGPRYRIAGDKHFGSGSGICDRMITTALPAGEDDPRVFVLDVRARPWDGSAGLQLLAEWDGMGMTATQSHAMRLDGAPAVRFAHDLPLPEVARRAGPAILTMFLAVVLGVLDEAVATARAQVRDKADTLRAYERVEWARAEQDHWLAVQAYEGALRTIESGDAQAGLHAALRAKQATADLAEGALSRLSRVIGGGTFSGRSPYAHWFEDVRALGFLRPPWGLAYDQLFDTSFA